MNCFSLGCGVGYGYLHRIPIRMGEPAKEKPVAAAKPPTPRPPTDNYILDQQSPVVSASQAPAVPPKSPSRSVETTPSTPTPVEYTPQFVPPSPGVAVQPPLVLGQPQLIPNQPPVTSGASMLPPGPPPQGPTTPFNPYSMSSVTHPPPQNAYSWNIPPHPAALGGTTTVQSSNYPPRATVNMGPPSGAVTPSKYIKYHGL